MELNQVEIIGLQPPQTLFNPGPDIFGRMDMLSTHASTWHATAFGGEKVFRAAMGNEPSH